MAASADQLAALFLVTEDNLTPDHPCVGWCGALDYNKWRATLTNVAVYMDLNFAKLATSGAGVPFQVEAEKKFFQQQLALYPKDVATGVEQGLPMPPGAGGLFEDNRGIIDNMIVLGREGCATIARVLELLEIESLSPVMPPAKPIGKGGGGLVSSWFGKAAGVGVIALLLGALWYLDRRESRAEG